MERNEVMKELKARIHDGMVKYGTDGERLDRIERELAIIEKYDLGEYILSVANLLTGKPYSNAYLPDQKMNYLYIFYLLGATKVDAVKYDLPLERFMVSKPDEVTIGISLRREFIDIIVNDLYAQHGQVERICDEKYKVKLNFLSLEYCFMDASVGKSERKDFSEYEILALRDELFSYADIEKYHGNILCVKECLAISDGRIAYQEQLLDILVKCLGCDYFTAEKYRRFMLKRKRERVRVLVELVNRYGDIEGSILYDYLYANAICITLKGYVIGRLVYPTTFLG